MKAKGKNTADRNRKAKILRDVRRADAMEEVLAKHNQSKMHNVGGVRTKYLIRGGIPHYESRLGVKLNRFVKEMMGKKKGPVRILDIACGEGRTLAELKNRFGKDVFVAGLSSKKLSSHKDLDRIYIRDAERKPVREKYDVIMTTNATPYFENFPKLIEKMFSSLNVGGVMMVDLHGSGVIKTHAGKNVPLPEYLQKFFDQNNELFDGKFAMKEIRGRGVYSIVVRKKEHGSFKLPIEKSQKQAKPFVKKYLEK